ncbi:MAG: GntR family transcriptional regulator [Clostridia bacterium]
MHAIKKPEKLWKQVYKVLLEEIQKLSPGQNRLPAEEDLAAQLFVSRATVRDAMQALINDGHLTRRHGKGNFVHPSVSRLAHRVDLTADFIELLSTPEERASCHLLATGETLLPEIARDYFPNTTNVFFQKWLYTSKGANCIYCNILTPRELFVQIPISPPECILENWMQEYCHKDIAYYATHLKCNTNQEVVDCFALPAQTYMQNWQEVIYDINDEPVSFVDLYFHPSNIDLSLVLKF